MRRLGLDIGTTSIGWALFEIKNDEICKFVDVGVRIFSGGVVPKTGASLAEARRLARSARRRRDRYIRRRTALIHKMADSGLMPANPNEAKELQKLDPYKLRTDGLDEKLPITHFGRALFHLAQRRGFKSNRKTDKRDNEGTMIKDASARLDTAMMEEHARTLGEFMHNRRKSANSQHLEPSVRARMIVIGQDEKGKDITGYNFYPDRRHIEEEFDKLWEAQAGHNPKLTDKLRDAVREIIFYQRKLRAPKVGRCRYYDEDRLPKTHPLTQRRVLYETVNSLRIVAPGKDKRALDIDQRDEIIFLLDNKPPTKSRASMNFKLAGLAKKLKLPTGERFSLESIQRDSIECDQVRAELSHPDRFGSKWSTLDSDAQWEVIGRIKDDEDNDKLVDWLATHHGLSLENAESTAKANLPNGYAALGETATRQFLEKLKADVIPYSEAVKACGMHHSDDRTGEILDSLPYYGKVLDRHVIPGTGRSEDDDITRYGRITNPTVHIGLNQLRRLMNAIIAKHGVPDEIVVELARDLKQSKKQKDDEQKRILENRRKAELRSEKLRGLDVPDNGDNRALLRLFEELNLDDCMKRVCPYSGEPISIEKLFKNAYHVDHILPYSQTLDNSFANRTLCLKEKNLEKGNKTPWEAWGDSAQWKAIESNLKNLPAFKQWRFQPDALVKFGKENDLHARTLTDTRYLSRIAKQYLETLYTEGGHVRVAPGRLTEMLRRRWGLNTLLSKDGKKHDHRKNRADHRHHTIDAAVVAATDPGLVQRISIQATKDEKAGAEKVAQRIAPPWKNFRTDLAKELADIIVSHRADHGKIDASLKNVGQDSTSGRLHNSTAYGIVNGKEVVSRMPLFSLTAGDIAETSKGKNIRDKDLQLEIKKETKGKEGKDLEKALKKFATREDNDEKSPYKGIRRIRMIEKLEEHSRVTVSDKEGNAYKAYKGDSNHCFELWQLPDGKYKARVVTTYEAHSASRETINKSRPHPAAKRVLRAFKRDMVAIDQGGKPMICYVQRFDQNGKIFLVEHVEANAAKRNKDPKDTFQLISLSGGAIAAAKVRCVHVDVMGRVRDPGPVKYS